MENIEIQEYFPNALRKKPIRNLSLLYQTIKRIRESDTVYVGGGGLLYGKTEE